MHTLQFAIALLFATLSVASLFAQTHVTIDGEDFHLNGQPTYPGRTWNGHRIEGLLLNSRMVQATYDDLNPETAVIKATDEATQWLLDGGWRNVLVEVNNETNIKAYDHEILKPARIHELITRVRQTEKDGRRLLVGTSYGGGAIPKENVVRSSDFILLHGNGVKDPARITEMINLETEMERDEDGVVLGSTRLPGSQRLHQ
jgi:hypothetical protein